MQARKIFEHADFDIGYDLEAETLATGRTYKTPEGNKYPSITTVLSILNREFIEAWKKRVGEKEAARISFIAGERGEKVHEICEKYLDNDPDWHKGYMPHIRNTFSHIKPVLDKHIGKIYAQEVPLYSDHLGVAGRVDCVAEFDGRLSIIDFKTSKRKKKKDKIHNYFMQESAYAIMWEERTGMPITQLVTIMAVDHDETEIFIEHRDNWTKKLHETIKAYKEQAS